MVATLVRLRFLLLFNALKKSPWQIIAAVVGALYGLVLLVLVVGGLISLSFVPLEFARTIIVLAGSALVFGWTVLPALTSGIDQTVDPARLVTFPIPTPTLLIGLTVSGVLGVPGIVTSIAALATVASWWRHPFAALAALVCAALGVLTCVIGSRMLVALSARIGTGRRVREAKTLLVMIPLILLGPIIFGLTQLLHDVQDVLPRVAGALSWTPLGAVWAVPADVAAGDFGSALAKFLIAVATLVVMAVVWRWALARAMESLPSSTPAKAASGGLGWFSRFSATPTGAVAARALTYWMRDPRYAQSLISIPLIPLLIFFYAALGDNLIALTAVGPIVAVLLAMSIYTDVAYDNTAFALHLQTGVSGRADRTGRVIALAVFAVPVSLLLTVGSVWVTGTWEILPGLLGITLGVLLTGFGLSSVVSGWFIFAVPAPGESPFKSQPGGGFSLMLSMFVLWLVLGVAVLPEFILALLSWITGNALLGWLSLVVGIVLGSVLLVVGIRVGGSILDRRGPDLLARLNKQK